MSTVFTKKFYNCKSCHPDDAKAFEWVQKTVRLELCMTLLNNMLPDVNYIVRYQETDKIVSNSERVYILRAWLGESENKNQFAPMVKE